MNFSAAVKANLEHMGTPVNEWSATTIKETQKTEINGKTETMPIFDFPIGYTNAPTLYPSSNTSNTNLNCEWCGTPIKKVFWIQNDSKKWNLMVGSECINHFGNGKTGTKLLKETVWKQNREYVRYVIKIKTDLWKKYSKKHYLGYGRTEKWISDERVNALYLVLKKITKNIHPDGKWGIDHSSNASITRWVNKHKESADLYIKNANCYLNS